MAPGIVAGKGDAMATSGGTPNNESSGVATDEPPTPNVPISEPIKTPATTTATGAS
jgi:hypothetical protein